ncbi:hypothetical protein BB559_000439 [Furculomyces boomerangus]|uniref:TEL2-interacting protein 1 n=1 Tax=Furculomyces boomerangus TaxID=61424 RepID=A0A2T9Z560_9FUNG|nr:hypothetical protein BB559_000439 [Furculomyces boomerangus]
MPPDEQDTSNNIKKSLLNTILKFGGIPVPEFSKFVSASGSYFVNSKHDNAAADVLLDLWYILLREKCIIPESISKIQFSEHDQQQIIEKICSGNVIIVHEYVFETVIKILSQIFCQKSTRIEKGIYASDKNTKDWTFSPIIRRKAIELWIFVLYKINYIFGRFSPYDDAQISFINPDQFFKIDQKKNLLAFCVLGLLDNIQDSSHAEVGKISLDCLFYLIEPKSNIVELFFETDEKSNNSIAWSITPLKITREDVLNTKNKSKGILISEKSQLADFFPGIASCMINIAIGNKIPDSTQNSKTEKVYKPYKPHIRAKSLIVLRSAINVCFSDKESLKGLDRSNTKSVASSWAKHSFQTNKADNGHIQNHNMKDITHTEKNQDDSISKNAGKSRLKLWDEIASEKLLSGFNILVSLRNSHNELIKLKLIELCDLVINECSILLRNVVPLCLQTLFFLKKASGSEISDIITTVINKLIKNIQKNQIIAPQNGLISEHNSNHSNIVNSLEGWFDYVLEKFPGFIGKNDTNSQLEGFALINGYITIFLKLTEIQQSGLLIQNNINSVKGIFKMRWEDYILPALIENLNQTKNTKIVSRIESIITIEYPLKGIEEARYDMIKSAMYFIGFDFFLSSVYSRTFDKVYQNQKPLYLQIMVLILDILSKWPNDVNKIQSPTTTSNEIETDLNTTANNQTINNIFDDLITECNQFVDYQNFSNKSSVADGTIPDKFGAKNYQDLIYIMNTLESLYYACRLKGDSLIYYLDELMYPLLALNQSGLEEIGFLSEKCLLCISDCVGSTNIPNLIKDNADFILNSCTSKIRQLDLSHSTLSVLISTMRYLDPQDSIILAFDIVDYLMDAIEKVASYGLFAQNSELLVNLTSKTTMIFSGKTNRITNQSAVFSAHNFLEQCLNFFIVVTKSIKDVSDKKEKPKLYISSNKSKTLIEALKARNKRNEYLEDKVSTQNESTEADISETKEADDNVEANNNQKLAIKIIRVVQNFISFSNPNIQLLALTVLRNIIPSLSETKEGLPLINHVWPTVIECANKARDAHYDTFYVTLASLNIISDMCYYSTSWLQSRIKTDVWPCIYNYLTMCINSRAKLFSHTSVFNSTQQLLFGYINTLESVFKYTLFDEDIAYKSAKILIVLLDERFGDKICSNSFNALKTINEKHSDIVWLLCYSFGDLGGDFGDSLDGLKNGFFGLDTRELAEHTHEHRQKLFK